MKKISLILFAALLSCSLFGLKVTADEKFTLSGKVTSISQANRQMNFHDHLQILHSKQKEQM